MKGVTARSREDEDRRATKSAGANRVQEARARAIELATAQRQGELIPTKAAVDFVVTGFGLMVSRLDGLPASVTRDLDLRRKIEVAIDTLRNDVADAIVQHEFVSAADAAKARNIAKGNNK